MRRDAYLSRKAAPLGRGVAVYECQDDLWLLWFTGQAPEWAAGYEWHCLPNVRGAGIDLVGAHPPASQSPSGPRVAFHAARLGIKALVHAHGKRR